MTGAEPTETTEELATLFKALADPTRLRLVGLMVDKERCGQELAHVLELSPATVSHHLKVLRQAGLLKETRARPYTFFRLDLATLGRLPAHGQGSRGDPGLTGAPTPARGGFGGR